MKIERQDLEKNQVELQIEVSIEELQPFLEDAAKTISAKQAIAGFRPGKAPYQSVKNKVGEMAIYQEALEAIISSTYYRALKEQSLESVGQPDIKIEKFAPGNPLVYKAKFALMPKVTLGDWKSLKVEKKKAEATNEDLEKTLAELVNLNAEEKTVDREIKKGDKIEIDLEVLRDNVLIEGGKSQKYPVIVGEGKMIPGFEDQLLGLKKNATKDFNLKFPEKYFQKNLAGAEALFKIKVVEVYQRSLPEVDDNFAKKLGFENAQSLKDKIRQNITSDKQFREEQRVEQEAITKIVDNSQITELPDVLIDNEVHKMQHELEHSIEHQGMNLDNYLQSISKTMDDLKNDFRPQAISRVKAALVIREIALENKIEVSEKELEEEFAKQKNIYKDNPQVLENVSDPSYRRYLKNALINEKTLKLIKETIIK